MSDYIVSARKYRPATFKTVVGQKALTETLKNAIDSKRLAQAYLFCGPRGVGKTSCARIFAKTINCLNPTPEGEACGECESCRAIDKGNSFNIIELDAASKNSVNDIRDLTEEVSIQPQVGNYRVFIIDEVHMLSNQAFNAFLKTLEEPPKYVVFILATTEKHKVIPTILSRCQIYDFKRITTADMVEHLQYVASKEGIQATPEALNVIARKADGAMRDALSIFDQVAASSMGNITYQSALANLNVLDYDYYFALVEAFRAGDVGQSLLIYNEIQEKGFDNLFFINGLASHVRDLMVAADPRTAKLLEVAEEILAKYTSQAQSLPLDWYYTAIKLINDADFGYRTATNKQLLVELLLIRLCQLLAPPKTPFDRVDNEPPLKMPSAVSDKSMHDNQVERSKHRIIATPSPSPREAPTADTTPVDVNSVNNSKVHSASNSASTSAPAPSTARKRKGLRLSELTKEKEKVTENRRNPFTPADLKAAWDEFITTASDKPILVNAMKSLQPQQIGEEEYKVVVLHPAQKQAFISNMTSLLEFIKNKVRNDFVVIQVEIDDKVDVVKAMPSRELFKDILQNNESIAGLVSIIDPELL